MSFIGSLFGGGPSAMPPPPPPPPAPPPPAQPRGAPASAGNIPAAAAGFGSTIITGPQGLTQPETTAKKALLGG